MAQTTPRTPLRRSRRGQPIPTNTSLHDPNLSDARPSGSVVYRRSTVIEDLHEEEHDTLGQELVSLETRFYAKFARGSAPLQVKVTKPSKGNVGKPNASVSENEIYNVGDTVLVNTMSKDPSVAVIVTIYEVAPAEESDERGCRVLVHWFTRPSQLPSIRAQRDHAQNEVHYSLTSESIIPPSGILSHCTVTSSHDESEDAPSKRRRIHVEANNFYCGHAVDARRGLFYTFDWELFREDVLAKLGNNVEGSQWGCNDMWHVSVATEQKTTSRPTQVGEGFRKRRWKEDETTLDPIAEADIETTTGNSSMDAAEVRAMVSDPEDGSPAPDDYQQEPEEKDADEDEDNARDTDDTEKPQLPATPRKRNRQTSAPRTPRIPRTPRTPRRSRTQNASAPVQPTPHSKAALRKRKRAALAIRPPPPVESRFDLQLETYLGPQASKDPWLRAMHVLHVAARPEALPCRDEEYGRILRAVEELLEEGSGGCIYISGVPGTGKTATVHAVVRELKRMAEHNETNPFTYVEINGLRIPEPSAAYGLLWEAVSGHDVAREGHMKISSNQALKLLSRHFSAGDRAGPGSHACVVLMDELDQLMTSKQDVVYNFFNWPTLVGSKLVVLAVANTMDLPERVMTGRVRSRLGMVRINFQPYTTPQLEKIVHARLQSAKEGLPEGTPNVIAPDGVKFAAMKVSSISGDARRVLDICRRTVELVQPYYRTARTDDVKTVIKEMQNSPTAAYLHELSFHERVMLAALLRCVKKDGVEEISWDSVQRQHLTYLNLFADDTSTARRPSNGELRMVLESLVASRAVLYEDGAAAARKAESERRIALNLEHTEIERVLGDVGGTAWKSALSL